MNVRGVIGLALVIVGAFLLIDLLQGHGDKLITLFTGKTSQVINGVLTVTGAQEKVPPTTSVTDAPVTKRKKAGYK
jgi:membrane-bound metal-dependent hydrolase YbcI (DUF457 family)